MKDEVPKSVRPVTFLSRTGSFIGDAIKSLAKGFGVEWRIAPEYPLPPYASVVLVAPSNDPKVLEELSSKCGVWDAKSMTACACYELILDQSPKAADKAAVDDGESLTDWLLSEYFFYGRNEFCFEGPDNLSQSDLVKLEMALASAVEELINIGVITMRRCSNRYKCAFFYVNPERPDSGPPSLYKRVRQVFSAPRLLAIKPERLANIAKTWPMTTEEMNQVVHFDSAEWTLYKVEVRLDTGKFICSTWCKWIGEKCFFVDIGFGDKVERIQWARSDYIDDIRMWCDNYNQKVVEFVESVNASLLADNAPFLPPVRPTLSAASPKTSRSDPI